MRKSLKKTLAGVLVCSMLASVSSLAVSEKQSAAKSVTIDAATIPNEQILSKAHDADTDGDGVLSDEEAKKVMYLRFSEPIADISQACELFPNMTSVYVCAGSNKSVVVNSAKLKSIEVSSEQVVALKGASPKSVCLWISKGKDGLDFSKTEGYEKVTEFMLYGQHTGGKITAPNASKLKKVWLVSCGLKKVDVSVYKSATELRLTDNSLTSINLKKNPKLTSFECYENKLTALNISANKKLKDVGVGGNKLKKIDISKNKELERVIAYSNKINTFKYADNKAIKELNFYENKLTGLKAADFSKLTDLNVAGNKMKKLDTTKNPKLSILNCSDNAISKLDLTKNKKLTGLYVGDTKLNASSLLLAKSAKLRYISVGKQHAILKNITLATGKDNYGCYVYLTGEPGKTYRLKELIPCLKGYTFSTNASDDKLTVSENGVVTVSKGIGKTYWYYISATKGNQRVGVIFS